ncbi:MAG: glycerol-3-phosphate acyltransferase [Deltaproteobacteria bacterium]|nr:glycerol-3-phosphate acyltransferase [Deltaproteobacteria bacterium]
MTVFFFLLATYLIGAIPTGLVLTRLAGGADVRTAGSGNIGATNVYRVAGRTLGILTLAGDCLKGVLPLLAAISLFQLSQPQIALVGVTAFLGHCYPVYLGFKGGKGVATALGVLLVLSPLTVLCGLVIFSLILYRWRFISLASVITAAAAPGLVFLFERSAVLAGATLVIAGFIIWRHRSNIERLRDGSENRFNL